MQAILSFVGPVRPRRGIAANLSTPPPPGLARLTGSFPGRDVGIPFPCATPDSTEKAEEPLFPVFARLGPVPFRLAIASTRGIDAPNPCVALVRARVAQGVVNPCGVPRRTALAGGAACLLRVRAAVMDADQLGYTAPSCSIPCSSGRRSSGLLPGSSAWFIGSPPASLGHGVKSGSMTFRFATLHLHRHVGVPCDKGRFCRDRPGRSGARRRVGEPRVRAQARVVPQPRPAMEGHACLHLGGADQQLRSSPGQRLVSCLTNGWCFAARDFRVQRGARDEQTRRGL